MYFGLCNLQSTFQRIMNNIFWELLYKEVLANYIDNFVISTKTKKELECQSSRQWTLTILYFLFSFVIFFSFIFILGT